MHQITIFLTLFCWYQSIYLYSCLQIIPPESIAILNNDHFYQCTLTVTLTELQTVGKSPFSFISPSMNCNVTNWLFCNVRWPDEPNDGFCGCTSKAGTQTLLYVFTLYRKTLPQSYHGQLVTCQLGGNFTASRTTSLHAISRKPGPIISVCEGQNLTFNWGFGFTYDFTQKYRVVEVNWKTPDYYFLKCVNHENKTGLAADYNCARGENIGVTEVSWVIPHQSANHDLPRLVYHNVPKAMRNTEILFEIVFEIPSPESESSSVSHEIKSLRKKRKTLENVLEEKDVDDVIDNTTISIATSTMKSTTKKATPSTRTTTTTTSTVSTTTPRPFNHNPGNAVKYKVTDSTKLDVLEPPSESMSLDFTGTKSLTGQVIVNCEINKASKLGEPPVNLTLWHNDKVIITREKTYLLRFMINIDKGNLTCNVVGASALCLGESFLQDLKIVLDIKDIKTELETVHSLDYHLLLYMCQSLACLVIMIVTIGLVIEHIRSILRRRRRLLELQLKALEEKRAED